MKGYAKRFVRMQGYIRRVLRDMITFHFCSPGVQEQSELIKTT